MVERINLKLGNFKKIYDFDGAKVSFAINSNNHGDFDGTFQFIEWGDKTIVEVGTGSPKVIEELINKKYGKIIRFPNLNTCKWCDEVYDIDETIQNFGIVDWANRYCSAKCYGDIRLDRVKRIKEPNEYIPKSHILYVSAMTIMSAYKTYRKSFTHISPKTMTPAIKEALKEQGLPEELVSLFYLSFVGHPMDLVHWADGVIHNAICPHCKQNQVTEGPCICR